MQGIAKMTVLDVEMGLAIRIEAPNGKWIVIDLGTSSKNSKNKSPLSFFKGKEISYMIITHPHMDHISDILNFDSHAPRILTTNKVLTKEDILALANDKEYPLEKYKKYVDIVFNRYNGDVSDTDPDNPHNPNNYGGLEIKGFALTDPKWKENINNISIITVLKLGNSKVVICGDNETNSLKELMEQIDFKEAVKDAYVLVAPHHGRDSAWCKEFVKQVNPYITIISDGKYKDYCATEEYSQNSMGYCVMKVGEDGANKRSVLTTRQDGDIIVRFGDNILSVYTDKSDN